MLLDANDIDSLLKNQGRDLSKRQLELVQQRGRENAAENILRQQMEQASKPGYAESVLIPVRRKILAESTKQTKPTQKESTEQEKEPALESMAKVGKKMTQKFEPAKVAKFVSKNPLPKDRTIARRRSFTELAKSAFEKIMGYNEDPVYVSKKIVTFLKKKKSEDKKLYNDKKRTMVDQEIRNDLRHKEIMDLFIEATKKQKKVEKLIKEDAGKSKKKKIKAKKTDILKSAVSGKATQILESVTKPSVATAVKIGAGVIAATGMSAVKAKIAGRESAGESDISYRTMNLAPGEDRKKGENIVKNLTEMTIPEVIEFAEKRGQKFGNTGVGKAAGKYQFMPKTLEETAKRVFKDKWKETKYSPENQEKLMDQLLQDNARYLYNANVPVNNLTLYSMHLTGSVEQARKIMESPDSTPMSEILSAKAKVANKQVAAMTVGQFKSGLSTNTIKLEDLTMVPTENTASPQIPQKQTGEKIDNVSRDTNDTKRDMAKNSAGTVLVNTNNNNTTQRNLMVKPTEEPHPLEQ